MMSSARMNEFLCRGLCMVVGFTCAVLFLSYRSDYVLYDEQKLVEEIRRTQNTQNEQIDNTNNVVKQDKQDKQQSFPIPPKLDQMPLTATDARMTTEEVEKRIQLIKDNSAAVSRELLKTRVLCMVLSRPNSPKHIAAVRESWGKRCAKLVLLAGGTALNVTHLSPTTTYVNLPLLDNWDNTWLKVRQGIRYIHKVHRGQFDWFMRIDDDGYVIMENLILFLRKRDPTKPEMYGVHYKTYGTYIGTGAGLTISAYNFEKLVQSLDHDGCSKSATHNDDVEISACLKAVGINVVDSRDAKGRFRYFPLNPDSTFSKHLRADWLKAWLQYEMEDGAECCADDFIGFHYVSPEHMRTVEFLTYIAHPFSSRELWNPTFEEQPDNVILPGQAAPTDQAQQVTELKTTTSKIIEKLTVKDANVTATTNV